MSDLLNIGRTGLAVSKKSLETTGHNIANANTEGYSRQRVNQTTNIQVVKGGLNHGTGARIKSVTRTHDPFVEKRFQSAISNHEFNNARANYLGQVEEIFNEVDNGGLNQVMNKFFNSFRDLANQPENETIRSVVRDNANLVIKDFKRIRSTLDHISKNIDNTLNRTVSDMNYYGHEIAKLNRRIAELEADGQETGDLRDQRDLALKNLSKLTKVKAYENDHGNYVVNAEGVGTITTAAQVVEFRYGTMPKDKSSNGMEGAGEIFFEGRPATPLTDKFNKGNLAGIISVRNKDIKNLREKIDRIAYDFINGVNAIHRKGFVNREVPLNPNRKPASSADAKGPLTGIDFFKRPSSIEDSGLNIELSNAVKSDLTNITTALAPNSPGDNRVAIGISKLQHERFMGDSEATMEEYFLQSVGNVGLQSGKAQLETEQSEGILAQVTNLKERISGVSIDEEAANMVRFQHAYEASAKVMQTADKMFETVLNIKR